MQVLISSRQLGARWNVMRNLSPIQLLQQCHLLVLVEAMELGEVVLDVGNHHSRGQIVKLEKVVVMARAAKMRWGRFHATSRTARIPRVAKFV